MQKYVEFIANHRKVLLILFAIINLTALLGILRITINPDYEVFMPEGSKYKRILDEMGEVFPGSEQLIFLIETGNSELTVETLREFRGFQRFLEKMEKARYVTGPAPEAIMAGETFIELDDLQDEDLPSVESYYEDLGELSPVTVENGKLYGTFEVFPQDGLTNQEIDQIEDYLKERGLKYYASGDVYMQQKIMDYIWTILLFLPPCALLLLLMVFRLQMGSIKATFLSVLPAGIGALWTLGLVGWLGNEVSIITVLAPIFTVVIGSADGLHFVSHIQDERSSGKGRLESIVTTLKMVGLPMIITTVTSMAGFLSLLVMNNSAIKELAVFAATGILLAGVATWYTLPLILSGDVALKKHSRGSRQTITRGIRKIWGLPSVLILAVLLVVAFWGAGMVTTEFNQLTVYKEYTDVYQSFEKIMEINNGSVPVFLFIKTDGNPLDRSYAESIFDLEAELVESGYVGKALSAYDLYAVINSIMTGGEKTYPTSLSTLDMINSMFPNMDDNPANNLINIGRKATRAMVFPVNLKNNTLDEISSKVEAFNNAHEDLEVQVTGVQYLMRELNQNMIQNQAKSLLLAFVLIFLLLFVSLRSLKPSLISLLPIFFTVILLYGFLGLSGLSLNVITATIFGITIGVGIDYAIHFTSVWMSFKKEGCDSVEAVEKAYAYTSRPILANAFGIAIGLSALLFSPLRVHLFVSEMMWVAMLAGVFLSLSFLPTILRRLS